jgi:hypothetical protein
VPFTTVAAVAAGAGVAAGCPDPAVAGSLLGVSSTSGPEPFGVTVAKTYTDPEGATGCGAQPIRTKAIATIRDVTNHFAVFIKPSLKAFLN